MQLMKEPAPHLNWEHTTSSFTYSGEPVVRNTFTYKTPLGTFKVFESVSGNPKYKHPFVKTNWADPFNEIYPAPSISCNSLDEGKVKCEEIWAKVKEHINNF